MKKKILASIVLVIILAISGCGSSPNQPADNSQTSQTQESTTTTNTDTETESKTEQTSDSDTSNDTSMNEEDSQVISGIVEDATMNTITIQTSDGQSLSFATEGAETSYKDGLIIGIPVKITYTGEIKETDTSDTKVIRIVEEN